MWHQRGLWRSLHRYVFQLVMTSVHRKMFNECVPHPLVGRGLCDKRETPRIMGIFSFACSCKNTVPRFTQEFEAHHLDPSLRSCVHVLRNQICCFSRLYAVKAEQLYVDAAFHDGGGWASRENNCDANAITCEVWHGGVWLLVQLR